MITNRKDYRNYGEQVFDNVLSIEPIDIEEFDEFWHEPLFDLCWNNLSEEKLKEIEEESGCKESSDDFLDYVTEYIYDCFESIYVTYKVELKGDYNSEHERLEIVWNDEANCYVMPVYAFGMAWSMLGVSN